MCLLVVVVVVVVVVVAVVVVVVVVVVVGGGGVVLLFLLLLSFVATFILITIGIIVGIVIHTASYYCYLVRTVSLSLLLLLSGPAWGRLKSIPGSSRSLFSTPWLEAWYTV